MTITQRPGRQPEDHHPAIRTSRRALFGAAAGAVAAGVCRGPAGSMIAAQEDAEANVLAYPAPGTRTASPYTEISFRDVTADALGTVIVSGAGSGVHSGILESHADGNGCSFLPDARFEPGEEVTVQADVPLSSRGDDALVFTVARPAQPIEGPADVVVDDPLVPPREFRSRPGLQPPEMEVTTPAEGTAPGKIFVAPKIYQGLDGVMILDDAGEVGWYEPAPVDELVPNNFRVQEYLGQPVLTWSEGILPKGYGRGHFVICDTSYRRIAEFQPGNGYGDGGDLHEFVLTPRGTAFIIIYHGVDWDLSPVGGSMYGSVLDCITQEVEIETGRVLFEWHSLDHIALTESQVGPSRDQPYDYVHQNCIEEDADGNLIICSRHTFAIYKIDRRTNRIIWRLGGKRSDFTIGENADFAWQHDARVHPNGELTLFDNHSTNKELEGEEASRGLVLRLDEQAMTATFVREYVHPDRFLSRSQGNMQVLPNGNVFIGWGSEPFFSEFSHDGELLFDCRFPNGGKSYRAYRHEWTGTPAASPDIAVELGGQGLSIVYASWNGATGVASWRVMAGSTSRLMDVVTAPVARSGFETAITVDVRESWYSVQALDAAGSVIGTANAVQPAS